MNCNRNELRLIIEDSISTVFKIFLFYRIITWYGIFFGLPFILVLFACYRRVISRIFHIIPCTPYDICLIDTKIQNRFNLIGSIIVTDFNCEALKKMIIERGIQKIKKLRFQLIYRLFNFYWKEVPLDEAIKRIVICQPIKDEIEFNKILNNELNEYIDVNNELPYIIKLIPYADSNKGIIMFHFDHLLSDGLGVISLMCALSDNYDPNNFPSIMLNYKEDSIFQTILGWVLFPIYGLYASFLMFFTNSGKNPFRTSQPSKGTFNLCLGNKLPLMQFNTNRKKMQMTFNQAIISAISLACKQICDDKGYKSNKYLKFMMPVGRKAIPTSIEAVKLSNEAKFVFLNIPLIESGKDFDLVRKDLMLGFRNEYLNNSNSKWVDIIGRILSFRVMSFFGDLYFNNVDFVLSNLPGPTKEIKYQGSRVERMYPVITPGRGIIFAIVMSYNNSFQLNISIDEKLNIDANDMLERIEKGINDYFINPKDN